MKCKLIRMHLEDYHKQRLDATTEHAVTTHLATCQECRRELAFLKTYLATLEPLECQQAPADLPNRVETAIASGPHTPRLFWNRRLWYAFSGVSFAATMVIIIALCIPRLMFVQPEKSQIPKTAHAKTEPIESGWPGKAETAAHQNTQMAKVALPKETKTVPRVLTDKAQPVTVTLLVTLPAPIQSETLAKPKSRSYFLPQAKQADTASMAEKPEVNGNSAPDEELQSTEVQQFKAALERLLQDYQGEITMEDYTPDDPKQLSRLTLTVPAKLYHQFLTELGKVTSFSQTSPQAPTSREGSQQIEIRIEYR